MTKKRRALRTKPLTQHQTWLVVATAFRLRTGICSLLSELKYSGLVSAHAFDKMREELGAKRPPSGASYWWPLNEEGNEVRVKVALELAKASQRRSR